MCFEGASTALAAELHRRHGYRVRFNDDSNYPKILEIVEEVPLPKPRATAEQKSEPEALKPLSYSS